MALVGAAAVLKLVILSLLVWINILTPFCQGKEGITWEEKYPFIRRASTFSSPSPSSGNDSNLGSSNSGRNQKGQHYDYIIVGGGTAGCPLAATLSQNFSVLVLERGGVPFGNVNVSFMQNFHICLADTSFTSASQVFISTDGVFNSRARVLGGGTCINAGFYTRAGSSYIKQVGWDAKLVNESYHWVEKQIVHKPNLAPWQRAFIDGLIEAGVSPFNGFTYDHVYGTKVGGTIFDRFGRRHTAAELLASGNPRNLDVLVHARVQKIFFDKPQGKKPRAVGVIFKDEMGNEHQAFLSSRKGSEIILSSGAIGSPQLLLLSGIGPKNELKKLNIPVVLHNKYVGKGISDNPLNTIFIPSNRPVEQSLIQTVGITKLGVYIEASSGFSQSADSIRCHHGVASGEIGQLSTIPPKFRTQEAIEAYRRRKRDLPREVFQGGFILTKVAQPFSTGHINLINTNVDDNPSVTFNYFNHPVDVKKCVHGIRMVEKIVSSNNFSNFTQFNKDTWDKLLNMSVHANVNLKPRQSNDTVLGAVLQRHCGHDLALPWRVPCGQGGKP